MEPLLILATVAALGWVVLRVAPEGIERHVAAVASLVGGWRGDGWPIGVQEEDRDRPWGWRTPPVEEAAPTVRVSSVRPSFRLRS